MNAPADTPARVGSLWIKGPLSWIEIASIRSFVDLGHDYVLYSYGDVPNLPADIQRRDAREIWDSDRIIIHDKAQSPAIHADVFRAIMIRKTGRVWADTDVLALRPFPADLGWYIGHERTDRLLLGNAIMGFPENSRTMEAMYRFLTDPFPIPPWLGPKQRRQMEARRDAGEQLDLGTLPWGATGPQALTHFAQSTGEIDHAQPPGTFFPISFQKRKMLVQPAQIAGAQHEIAAANSLCVHLYSRWLRKFTARNPGSLPAEGSWLGQYLALHNLVDDKAPPQKTRAKGQKAKPDKIEAAPFYEDLAQRRMSLPGPAAASRHGRITCISMAKDEGPYLLEWVAYHHLLGFTDILVYSNDCTDGTAEMLEALASVGLITHADNGPLGKKPPQSRALQRAQKHPLVSDADWIMVMDFDEFLTIRCGDGTVDALIDEITQAGATAMPVTWRFYGSGGHRDAAGQPVIDRFRQAATNRFSKGFGVKTLFRNSPHLRLAIHRPRVRGGHSKRYGPIALDWINGSGLAIDGHVMTWRQTLKTAGYDLAQVNHYGVKSGEEYLMRRIRGDVLNNHGKYDDAYFERYDRNEITDEDAAEKLADVIAFMDRLRQVPQVRKAEALIAKRYREKLARLRASDGYRDQLAALGFDPDTP